MQAIVERGLSLNVQCEHVFVHHHPPSCVAGRTEEGPRGPAMQPVSVQEFVSRQLETLVLTAYGRPEKALISHPQTKFRS